MRSTSIPTKTCKTEGFAIAQYFRNWQCGHRLVSPDGVNRHERLFWWKPNPGRRHSLAFPLPSLVTSTKNHLFIFPSKLCGIVCSELTAHGLKNSVPKHADPRPQSAGVRTTTYQHCRKPHLTIVQPPLRICQVDTYSWSMRDNTGKIQSIGKGSTLFLKCSRKFRILGSDHIAALKPSTGAICPCLSTLYFAFNTFI